MRFLLLLFLTIFSATANPFLGLASASVNSTVSVLNTNGLIAYYPLDEESTGAGAVTRSNYFQDTYHLTDGNTTTSAAGKLNNAAVFDITTFATLSTPDNADFSIGADESLSVTFWLRLTNTSVSCHIVNKDNGTSTREWNVFYSTAANRLNFTLWNSSDVTISKAADDFGGLSVNTWYFVCAVWNGTTDTVSISVNAGTPSTLSNAGFQPRDGTHRVTIGANAAGNSPVPGMVDEVWIWSRALDETDASVLYNGGAGYVY